jgi:hypothetical protein
MTGAGTTLEVNGTPATLSGSPGDPHPAVRVPVIPHLAARPWAPGSVGRASFTIGCRDSANYTAKARSSAQSWGVGYDGTSL